jgi:hypothetical protein
MVQTDPKAALGTLPITQLEQLYWTNATPMETNFASVLDASIALPQLESSAFTGTTGFYQQAAAGGRQASAVNTGVMAIAEANYGRMDQSLRYVSFVADELDVEQPGALPELFPSPDYPYFPSFGGAMVMQAWSSYGIHSPLVESYLGIKPNAPARTLSVVPDLPSAWNELSVDHLRVGPSQIAASVRRSGTSYSITVEALGGWRLTIGYPAGQHPGRVGQTEWFACLVSDCSYQSRRRNPRTNKFRRHPAAHRPSEMRFPPILQSFSLS